MPTETYTLRYDDVPKSVNDGGTGSRRHWGAAAKEKKMWEGIYCTLLLTERVRRGMTRCYVEVMLEYSDSRRRDSENYRSSVSKPFADALVKGGWLADDTDEFYELGRVRIISGCDVPRKRRMTILMEADYA